MIKKMYLVLVICFLSFIVLACNETKDDDKQNEVKEYNVTFYKYPLCFVGRIENRQ